MLLPLGSDTMWRNALRLLCCTRAGRRRKVDVRDPPRCRQPQRRREQRFRHDRSCPSSAPLSGDKKVTSGFHSSRHGAGGFNQATQVGAMGKIMSESTHRKSALPSTVRHPVTRVPIGSRCIALCVVLVFANLPALTYAQSSCPGIHVKILGIRNSTGAVACALFEAPEGFPTEFLHSATNIMIIKVRDTQARCDFEDIPPGTYALAVIHDENMDGKLGTNWLGVPTEGYGFSNDAKAFMRAPSFDAASFPYDGRNLDLTISLSY